MKKTGVLYIVATPIGNLQDITLRGLETLRSVDLIAAEDTRHSAPLLQHFSIQTPLISLHEHNEKERSSYLLSVLLEGKSIALISDAGTPLISDPGFILVNEVRKSEIKIVPIPGPCAAIAALCASGLETNKFVFEGFLPSKSQARKERLKDLRKEQRTLVFYEAPHRIVDLIEDMVSIFGGDRTGVLARELTKYYETFYSGLLSDLLVWIQANKIQQKGEMVLIIEGVKIIESDFDVDKLLLKLLDELPLKKAIEILVEVTNEKRNVLYERALEIKKRKQDTK